MHTVLTSERLYRKVRKFVIQQVESARTSGKTLARGAWERPGCGEVCAVGAIGLNGHAFGHESTSVYVLAAKELKQLGVAPKLIGLILDSISAGFEDYSEVTNSVRDFRFELKITFDEKTASQIVWGWPQMQSGYERYKKLGQYIRKTYMHNE